MRPAASGAVCRPKAGGTAEPGAPMAPSPLLPADRAAAPSVLDSARASLGLVSGASSPPGQRRALERAKHRSRAIETVSATAPLKNGGLAGPRRLPPVGNPVGPRRFPACTVVHARFDSRRPFTRRVSLRASPRMGAFSRNQKRPDRTDAANRPLQPSKSMGTPTGRLAPRYGTRCFGAFRRPVMSGARERHGLRS
jgi:hypothetical protein